MTALKANLCTVKIQGTSTAMTGEVTTDVGGTHTVYQITAAAKRAIDPTDTGFAVKKNGDAVSSTLFSVDYAWGKVTFASPLLETDVITIDGKYLPLLSVAFARVVDVEGPTWSWADATSFGDTADRKVKTRKKCKVVVEHLTSPDTDLDSGGGTTKLVTMLEAGAAVFLEVDFATAIKLRGWFYPEPGAWSHKLDDVQTGKLSFEGVLREGYSRPAGEQTLFSIG